MNHKQLAAEIEKMGQFQDRHFKFPHIKFQVTTVEGGYRLVMYEGDEVREAGVFEMAGQVAAKIDYLANG